MNDIDHNEEDHLYHDLEVNNGAPSIKDEEENDVIIENIESPFKEIDGSYHEYVNLPNKFSGDGVENVVENNFRRKRQANESELYAGKLKITGFRVEESDKEPKIVDGGIPSVLLNTKFVLRLFGDGFTNDTMLSFTHVPARYGEECRHPIPGEHKVRYYISNLHHVKTAEMVCIKNYRTQRQLVVRIRRENVSEDSHITFI